MKQFVLLLFICVSGSIVGQDCDYNYDSSIVMVEEKHVFTMEQLQSIRKKISEYKSCMKQIGDHDKLCWLNASLAQRYYMMNAPKDSIVYHTKRAFGYNTANFCQDYVKVHVYFERDKDFPMRKHYLDVLDIDGLKEIKNHCIENFRADELKVYADLDRKKLEEQTNAGYILEYAQALEVINTLDQKERAKSNLNWKVQNELDAANREALDVLYERYGYPTKTKVGKEGLLNAFLVLHHSKDCAWNQKWTRIFLDNKVYDDLGNIVSYYLYRNFNDEDGICHQNEMFWKEIKEDDALTELLDFDRWEKIK